MEALVVFESMFGNNQAVATTVARTLSSRMDVRLTEVGAAPTVIEDGIGLLVVGCPTHAFGLSRPETRREAAREGEHALVSAGIGVREWLDALRVTALRPPVGAVFATRINRPRLPGTAASPVVRRLTWLGLATPAPPESFYVGSKTGPLLDGELERAARWADDLAAEVVGGLSGGRR